MCGKMHFTHCIRVVNIMYPLFVVWRIGFSVDTAMRNVQFFHYQKTFMVRNLVSVMTLYDIFSLDKVQPSLCSDSCVHALQPHFSQLLYTYWCWDLIKLNQLLCITRLYLRHLNCTCNFLFLESSLLHVKNCTNLNLNWNRWNSVRIWQNPGVLIQNGKNKSWFCFAIHCFL